MTQADYASLQTFTPRPKPSYQIRSKRQGVAAGKTVAPAWLPLTVDWRLDNLVTPIKNQGGCGDCYTFSASGGLEGQYARKHGTLISLGEQQATDCTNPPNNGCGGGDMGVVFDYVANGTTLEANYPFFSGTSGSAGTCQYSSASAQQAAAAVFTNSVMQTVYLGPTTDETALLIAVARQGPISVGMDASAISKNFTLYTSGVYNNPGCLQTIDHAVLVVGYGTDPTFGPYWLIKNSWGTTWGENGYFRMARNAGNMCSVATYFVYPVIV